MVFRYFALVSVWVLWAGHALSHGGGLDSNGGHRERATGHYHCHQAHCLSKNDQVPDVKSIASNDGLKFSTLYDRKAWPHWIDEDGDCQDTRAEILIKFSQEAVKFKRNRGCNVSHGRWTDPYTGNSFTRATDLDIDHVVPLAWAHGHGGTTWSRERKRRFANDWGNLQPVQASVNREKGSQGPDDWLPPNMAYRCQYLNRFMTIVREYGLRLESVEKLAVSPLLNRCGVRR